MGESVMQEAQRIIHGDRNESYGPYERESERIAKGWSLLLGHEVDPKKVPLMMIWLKVSREIHSHKRDNLVDICGYAGLLDELFEADSLPPQFPPLEDIREAFHRRATQPPLPLEGPGDAVQLCDSNYQVVKDGISWPCDKEAGHKDKHTCRTPIGTVLVWGDV